MPDLHDNDVTVTQC